MTMKTRTPTCVLTIAGSDSGSGAGVQADARTIHALGGYAVMAITAVTAQNTRGVKCWEPVSPKLLGAQIEAVLSDFRVAAIKTGLLPGAAAVRVVMKALAKFPDVPLVIDPVIGSTSGTRFLSDAGLRVLKEALLPRAALVTPNWLEAQALSGMRVERVEHAVDAARRILALGCGAVLVKGGHATGTVCEDVLVGADDNVTCFAGSRINTGNTHGTGCVLSAAIALEIGRSVDLEAAVRRARTFLREALKTGRGAKWGGAGPAFVG
jgi:hydroxymethylpyrimidine/phosphomethylpyrimidine kinase